MLCIRSDITGDSQESTPVIVQIVTLDLEGAGALINMSLGWSRWTNPGPHGQPVEWREDHERGLERREAGERPRDSPRGCHLSLVL